MKKSLTIVLILFCLLSCSQQENNKSQAKQAPDFYVILQSGKYGYMDKNGTVVISAQFDGAGFFSEDYAPVNIGGKKNKYNRIDGGKWGFIDKTGKYIINPQYDDVHRFNDGIAAVSLGGKWGF
ncbi:MAG: WG repeat-containing protein, partial [Bacteroidota bacterium]